MRASPAATISILLSCALLAHCGGLSEEPNDDSVVGGASAGGAGGTGGADFCPEREDPPAEVVLPLDVYCAYFRCSSTLEEAITEEQARCTDGYYGQTLKEGCGQSALGSDYALGGGWQVFDTLTGALVGANIYSDVGFGPCQTWAYRAGVSFSGCDEAVSCEMCMPYDGVPACRFDCDCKNMEPVIDPCFGPDSCQCYCVQLEGTIGD